MGHGPDRRVVFAEVDVHDPRLIPHTTNVHAGLIWDEVFIHDSCGMGISGLPPVEK
jgi:hypothetical protein